jgi:hypothetical protein
MNKILLVKNNKEGSALIICLLSLAVISAIGISTLSVSTTNQTIVGNYKKQSQAFYVAEAGLHFAAASIKKNIAWRGATNPTSTGNMIIRGVTATYTVQMYDGTDDGQGTYNTQIPGGHIKLVSTGVFSDSTQTVESIVKLTPDPGFNANSPYAAVITTGGNTGSGSHVVNGYNNDGNQDPNMVLINQPSLPTVNQDALKAFADFVFPGNLTDEIDGVSSFWKDHPVDTKPYIINVKGNLDIGGNKDLYGIIFVEGTTVTLSGAVRIHGVIYAPNATVQTTINGGGSPGDQPVMGQVICGTGGVNAAGNHADVQLVKDYVDAFNNYGGAVVNVSPVAGSWRQY